MEHIYLIPNERMVLEQRGFFVKSIGSKTDIFDFFLELGMVFGMMVTGIFVLLSSFFIIQEGIGGITDLELSVVFQGVIILGGCIFFIAFTGLSLILLFNKKRFLYEREGVIYLMGKNSSLEISIRPEVVQYKDLGYTSNLFILFGIIPIVLFPKYMFLFFGCVIFLVFLIHTGVQIFHPLYAFGNIGEKIQKLTPEITSQSKLIQSEFEKDQNFGVLHSGFEKLAVTFSRIGELVLKLERVEKKANKGNLFDSEKYISSLRMDIVTPLVELKKFLEGQREELLQSQKELTRIMIGESTELTGNRELATKRGEEVLRELDGNIGKLDIMITKIA